MARHWIPLALRRVYENLEEGLCAALLLAICVVTMTQVVGRYVFASPPSWSQQLATILFVWLTFIGAALALKRGEHFAVAVVVDSLPVRWRRAMYAGISLVVAACCVGLLWFSIRYTIAGWDSVIPTLQLPDSVARLALPIGFSLMLLRTIEQLVGRVKALILNEPEAEQAVEAAADASHDDSTPDADKEGSA